MLKIIGIVLLVALVTVLAPGVVILAALAFVLARAVRMGWSR